MFASYSIGDWEVGLNTRLWGSAVNYTNVSDEAYDRNKLPAKVYNDLNVGWNLNENATLRVGINNLFDVRPSYRPRTYYQGGGGVYDVYGRYRSEEHTSELQSLMRISYAVFCLKKKNTTDEHQKLYNNHIASID